MSNYRKRESKNDFGGASDDDHKIINDIEVKVKPKSFENDKGKAASVGYVNIIIDKLVKDLNDTFVPELNSLFNTYMENSIVIQSEIEKLKTETIDHNTIDSWET
ncbi:MAG: hypothetical protein ACR5KV_05865 [Wolbachia sp.]